jgi:hypothetical protein
MASGAWKTGRYSKFLPVRLAARYAEAQADGELLALRDDIALVDTRVGELVQRIDAQESDTLWHRLRETWAEVDAARRTGDQPGLMLALTATGQMIRDGAEEQETWQEILVALDQRRKLVESERKRLVEMQQVITTERAMALLGVLVGIIKTHVSDRDVLQAISQDIGKLVVLEPGQTLGG